MEDNSLELNLKIAKVFTLLKRWILSVSITWGKLQQKLKIHATQSINLPRLSAYAIPSGFTTAKKRSRLIPLTTKPDRYNPKIRRKDMVLHIVSPAFHETV